jgi:hypothetical protein
VSGSPGSGPRFALIGPQASTALGSLVQEARTDGADKGKELLEKVSIYNLERRLPEKKRSLWMISIIKPVLPPMSFLGSLAFIITAQLVPMTLW